MLSVLCCQAFFSLVSSIPCPQNSLSSGVMREIIDEDLQFRTECSKISHSLYIFQLWVFVFAHFCGVLYLLISTVGENFSDGD